MLQSLRDTLSFTVRVAPEVTVTSPTPFVSHRGILSKTHSSKPQSPDIDFLARGLEGRGILSWTMASGFL